jgi:NADPH:quinone reductase-like Zn-dependent oxidoreductase
MSYKKVIIKKFGGPDVLQVIEEPELPKPKFGEVRIKTLVTSAAFTDTMIRKGQYPDVKEKPPFSPGYDLIGIVDKLGEGVTKFKIGQKVADLTVIGAYTEYICLPESRLTRVPDELDPVEAVSLILTYVTAYQMLHRYAKIKSKQRILIHGAAGAVGTAILQLGKLLDLEMYGTASKSKHELITELGATPIDYRSEDFVESIKAYTNDGVDAAFDPIGGENFKRSLKTLKSGGILVAYGFYNASTEKGGSILFDFLRIQLMKILPNRRSVSFYSIGSLRKKHPDWFIEDLTNLFTLLSQNEIRPVIGKRMPFADAAVAHELLERAAVPGKIVLMFSEENL